MGRTLLIAALSTPAVWLVAAWVVGRPVGLGGVLVGVATVLLFVAAGQVIDTQLAASYLPIVGLLAGALGGLLVAGFELTLRTTLVASGVLLVGMLLGAVPAIAISRRLGLEADA